MRTLKTCLTMTMQISNLQTNWLIYHQWLLSWYSKFQIVNTYSLMTQVRGKETKIVLLLILGRCSMNIQRIMNLLHNYQWLKQLCNLWRLHKHSLMNSLKSLKSKVGLFQEHLREDGLLGWLVSLIAQHASKYLLWFLLFLLCQISVKISIDNGSLMEVSRSLSKIMLLKELCPSLMTKILLNY